MGRRFADPLHQPDVSAESKAVMDERVPILLGALVVFCADQRVRSRVEGNQQAALWKIILVSPGGHLLPAKSEALAVARFFHEQGLADTPSTDLFSEDQ
jgi:hypothetical protein